MTSRKAAGFRVAERLATIDFAEDSPFYGVEARVKISIPFRTLFWFQRNASNTDGSAEEALSFFADDYLISWNLEDENGNPYPASAEGIKSVPDAALVTALMEGWIEAVTQVPDPLSKASANGHTSAEPMMQQLAASSTNLGN